MKYLATALLLLLSQFSSSQTLIKLRLVYNREIGHGVTMYYLLDSLEKSISTISQIQKANERNLLSSFGLPLGETGFYYPECVGKDTLNLDYNDFLSQAQKISINGSIFDLKLSLIKVSTDYCTYNLYSKHWGSYDVHFLQAAVLTSQPKTFKFSKKELKKIKALKRELSSLLKKDDF